WALRNGGPGGPWSVGPPRGSTRWCPIRGRPASTAGPGGSAVSKSFPGRTSRSRPWRSTEKCPHEFRGERLRSPQPSTPKLLAGDALEFVAEGGRFFGSEFDD